MGDDIFWSAVGRSSACEPARIVDALWSNSKKRPRVRMADVVVEGSQPLRERYPAFILGTFAVGNIAHTTLRYLHTPFIAFFQKKQ
jgi:hypothetical protein